MVDSVAPQAALPAAATARPLSAGYRRYALVLLLVIYIFNFLDRQVVNILAEPIKTDLQLADWQLGLMSGFAFAVFYSVLGVPIARLAEHGSRPLIIAGALTVWSAMTALCGAAQNFLQLCLFRIGVGVGEAGCTPPAHSLITDYTPKEKRASALAFYSMGVPLGSLLGMALGGVIADLYGWRAAFLVAGLPGLLLALITAVTLRETRSRVKADMAAARAAQPSFGAALRLLAAKRTFWLIAVAAALKAFISYGFAPFTASFFLRNHTAEVAGLAERFGLQSVGFLGLALGVLSGAFGAISAMLGGWVADKAAVRDVRNCLVAPAVAVTLAVPLTILAISVDSAAAALAIMIGPYLLQYFWYGPVYSTTQGIVPPHMRATAAAILLLIVNLIGLGLGPLMVGVVSDLIASARLAPAGLSVEACRAAAGGPDAATCAAGVGFGLRWSLIGAALVGLLSGVLFWMARKTIREDLQS